MSSVCGIGATSGPPSQAAVAKDSKIGKLARPKRIVLADDLPKTRSGKIMRRLLRDIAEGKQKKADARRRAENEDTNWELIKLGCKPIGRQGRLFK
jgi:hypothetical protein